MKAIAVELVEELHTGPTRDELAALLGGPRLRVPERPKVVGVELGVQKGEYSEILLRNGVDFLYLVDCWRKQGVDYKDIANVPDAEQAENLRQTKMRMEPYPDRHAFLIGLTVEMAASVPDGSLDFIYVDADHKYASVIADLKAWGPKVRPGGTISGHDYMDDPNCCGSEFGVRTAVREYAASLGVTTIFRCPSDGPFHNWYFDVPV